MSDEKKVEPAKTRAVNVEELKKQVDGLAAYVRKIVKRLEELGGIDINMDGKVGLIIISLMLLSGVVLAADTQVSGYTNETNVGTFYVSTDGTDSTLTVDKLSVLDATTLPGGYVSNVTAQTASVAGSVTLTMATNTIYYMNADTNLATNIVIYISNVSVTTAGVTTNVTVTRK